MNFKDFLNSRKIFTYQEACLWQSKHTKGKSPRYMQSMLAYYVRTRKIVSICKRLYAVSQENSLPKDFVADPYVLISKLYKEAVIAYHGALDLHGFAHSLLDKIIYFCPFQVLKFTVKDHTYSMRKFPGSLVKSRNTLFGTEIINRQGTDVRVTNKSRTFVDVLDKINLSGGAEEVFRSLENIDSLDIDMVIKYCLMLKNASLVAKIGCFLEYRKEKFGVTDKQLSVLESAKPRYSYVFNNFQKNCVYIKRWSLHIPRRIANEFVPNINLQSQYLTIKNCLKFSEDREKLLEGLEDLLVSIGLNEDGKPNNVGIQLEHLIGKFILGE